MIKGIVNGRVNEINANSITFRDFKYKNVITFTAYEIEYIVFDIYKDNSTMSITVFTIDAREITFELDRWGYIYD